MNSVGVQTVQQPTQLQCSDGTANTKHWSRSRIVRVVAGVAVVGLGALAGLALSFFTSTFTAILVAGAVSVILGGAVYGYLRLKSQTSPVSPTQQSSQPPPSINPALTTTVNEPIQSSYMPQEQRAQDMLSRHGYRLYPGTRDGNCFYDAIAHQCQTEVANALELRMRVADFARAWHQRHPQIDANFTAVEGRAHARLGNDVAYSQIRCGLDELATPDCFADQIDAYFAARTLARPIVITDISGDVTLAVDENGVQIDQLQQLSSEQMPEDAIVLIHDQNHFMGVDPI